MSASPSSSPADGSNPGAITGLIALAFGACCIGFAAIFVKASDLGPQAIAFWRLALALPILAAWFAIDRLARARRGSAAAEGGATARPGAWKLLGLAGVFFAGDLAFWHAGIKITTAANATLFANLTPIPVALAALVLFGERFDRRFIIAGALALTGAALLSLGNVRFAPERLPGDALSLLTALWYAGYLLAVRAARRLGAATVSVMFVSTLVASPIALLVTLSFGETLLPQTAAGWLPLIGLGALVHVGGQGAIAFGLGRTPSALASLVILIQPVVAAAAGWRFFGEALTPLQWAGAGLVLLGVYAAQRARPSVSTPGAGAAKPEP